MPTLFDLLFDTHTVSDLGDGMALIALDRILLHERTGAAALRSLAAAGRPIINRAQVFAVMDHIVSTLPGRGDVTEMPGGTAFITDTRAAAHAAGITLVDVDSPDQGITHVMSPELGIVLPGLTLVAPDSHTGTQGAAGALAWGIGSSEAEHALATGTLRVQRPKTMRIFVSGGLGAGVTAKDLALHLIAVHGAAGGQGMAVEFAGPAIDVMPMEGRFTLCNMATEFGAFSALIAPDDRTIRYFQGRRYAPTGAAWDHAVSHWRTLRSAPDGRFDREIGIDASTVAPMVSWGTSPAQSVAITAAVPADAPERPLAYMGLAPGQPMLGLPIDAAFIGSCTNARLSDLERAAAIIRGRRVAPSVHALVVPGSRAVKRAAEAVGLDRIFTAAGFQWRDSGCSLCFYAGGESFGPGQRAISSTNRNFESRQGPGTRTHIASPETVAASAIAGSIADPREPGHG